MSNFPDSNILQLLDKIGFLKAAKQLFQLRSLCDRQVAQAGPSATLDNVAALPSFIPAVTSKQAQSSVLAIDIGGTSTKAGLRFADGRWKFLFEMPNKDLKIVESKRSAFACFAAILGQKIAEVFNSSQIKLDVVTSFGVVWSNAILNQKTSFGITGIVARRENYTKGEWFINDMRNGDDLGETLRQAFTEVGLTVKHLVITNDTPFTMTALNRSDAGVVASTGVNATILKSERELRLGQGDELLICNSEIGNTFSLDSDVLSEGDCIESSDIAGRGQVAGKIEFLIGGKFLPQIFAEHIVRLSKAGAKEFDKIAAYLEFGTNRYREYSAADITLLLKASLREFLEKRKDPKLYSAECLESLQVLARAVTTRAAKLAAIVVYGSVCGQLILKDKLRVALESRLSREMPGFLETLKATTQELVGSHKTVEIILVEPLILSEGSISVPMQGAARAVDAII